MVLPPTPSAGVRAAELAENGYFRTVKAIRRYSTHFFNTYSIMRRSILHLAIVAIAGLSLASAQAQDGSNAPILRDNRVDTAILSRPIDPKMDLSRLPLYLLRVYRQIPAAQQGYWIMQQDLNALFSQTDWYENRADEAASHEDGEPFRAVLKPDEQAFVDRVKTRERELLKQNFTVPKGYRVNLRNLANQGLSRRVRVMINGTAIYAVQGDNDWTEAMREAAQDGAVFEICSRSVANHRLPPQTLPEWLTTVDAAIPAIARYTAEGWTYVKP